MKFPDITPESQKTAQQILNSLEQFCSNGKVMNSSMWARTYPTKVITVGEGNEATQKTVYDIEKIQDIYDKLGPLGMSVAFSHMLIISAINASDKASKGEMSQELLAFVNAAVAFRDANKESLLIDNNTPVNLTFNPNGSITVSEWPEDT